MALKPLRPCRKPGCPNLTREGYCPEHKPKPSGRRRSAEWHSWYSLPVWTQELRPRQLLEEPWCCECANEYPPGDPRHRTRATVVDHKQPFRGDWSLFTDRANLQSLCKRHHDRKTARERAEDQRKNNGFCP